MEKKRTDFKLPTIEAKGKDSRIFTNSYSQNSTKVRPSSHKKVEDLEKKLFAKLDAYQGVSTKAITKKLGRKSKMGQVQNTPSQIQLQGYQKMQKLMPGLYNKLMEAKKTTYSDIASSSSSTIQTPSHKSQQTIQELGPRTSQMKKRQQKIGFQQTSKQQKMTYSQNFSMTEEQMNALYSEYRVRQNLGPETSLKQLQNLGKDLNYCQKQIQQLTKSMQGLIKHIGMQCVEFYERQDDNEK